MSAIELTAITTNIKQIIADIDSELILTTEKYNKYKGNYYSIEYHKQIGKLAHDFNVSFYKKFVVLSI